MQVVNKFGLVRLGNQRGISLIEVLISMFVLAVGILGIVSLQALSIRDGVNSQYLSRAQMVTEDLLNRIHSNRSGALSGDYAATLDASTAAVMTCEAAACTPAQLADYDLRQIASRMGAELSIPDSSFTLSFNNVLSEYSVALTWNGNGEDNYNPADCVDAEDNANPGCMFTVVRI